MIEYAYRGRFRKHRSIEDLPEFRAHLEREGITFKEWEKRNKAAAPDTTTAALKLRIKVLEAKFR